MPFLLEGLKKLEYRGYDSAGIATLDAGHLFVTKCVGKIVELEKELQKRPIGGSIGIGHTRWATHGRPSDENSHPHCDCKGEIAVVHNGIIENYLQLRRKLSDEGHIFTSTTDTEVLAHMIEDSLKKKGTSLEEAVKETLNQVEGSYAIAVVYQKQPNKVVAARKGSPLVLGVSEGENFISSDIPALLKYTSQIIYLNDYEMATITAEDIQIQSLKGHEVKKQVHLISWDPESAEKGGYAHFMLKEIHEQSKAIRDTIAGRVKIESSYIHFDELNFTEEEARKINRIVFTACGTSWHAGLVGEYLIEQYVKIPSEVEYAAEFRYRHPIVDENTLVIAISQSGETADTLGAIWEAKAQGAKVISICNVVGSSIARESHGVIYTYAGPEIGVASTKAFTTQLTIIYLFALYLAKKRNTMPLNEIQKMISDLIEIPDKIDRILLREKDIEKVASKFYKASNAMFLGRGKGFPVALEGALKLKEISYTKFTSSNSL